jgi:two-component system CheB/CheR fusion protein
LSIPYEREIYIDNDTWMLVRIQPYSTLDNMIDGVVLTFTDISTRVKAIVTQEVTAID